MVPSLENFRDSKRTNFMSQLAKLFATRKPFPQFSPVLWIRIQIGSVFRTFVHPDPDPDR